MKKLVPLIHARIEAGFSRQSDLADASGIHRNTIVKWENCKFTELPNGESVVKLAKAIDVPIRIIIEWFAERI